MHWNFPYCFIKRAIRQPLFTQVYDDKSHKAKADRLLPLGQVQVLDILPLYAVS
jgi:hypothetical protein